MILVMCYNKCSIYAMEKETNCVADDTREESQEQMNWRSWNLH